MSETFSHLKKITNQFPFPFFNRSDMGLLNPEYPSPHVDMQL